MRDVVEENTGEMTLEHPEHEQRKPEKGQKHDPMKTNTKPLQGQAANYSSIVLSAISLEFFDRVSQAHPEARQWHTMVRTLDDTYLVRNHNLKRRIVLKLVHQKFLNPKTELKPAKIVLLMALRLVLTFMLKFE